MLTKPIYILFFSLLSVSQKTGCANNRECKGTPKTDCVCIEVYKPVCGCDGKTYSNDCHAGCAGVKKWTEGECPTK